MAVRASAEVRAKLVVLRSEYDNDLIAALRAVRDELPALWAGIAEDTLTSAELWAAYRHLTGVAGRVAVCAQRRVIRKGQPEL